MTGVNNQVLDASALVAYVNSEPGGHAGDAMVTDPDALCYAHAVNLCEVY